jgi:hypothetical protein
VIHPDLIRIALVEQLPLPSDPKLRQAAIATGLLEGSIAAFLPTYLQQIVDFGYANAPFEVDARRHEISA